VEIEAAVFPGIEHLNAFGRKEFLGNQELDDLGAEELFQEFKGRPRQGQEGEMGWRRRIGG
jgi:hypothetical protein